MSFKSSNSSAYIISYSSSCVGNSSIFTDAKYNNKIIDT
jgi:hypothetical protein